MWKTVKLGSIATVIAGQSPKGEYYNKEGKGTPFYQGKKDYGERFLNKPTVWTSVVTKLAEKDDILMSVRAPVGALNIATEQICIGRGLAAIRPTTDVMHDYLFYSLLQIASDLEGSAGAIFNSINKSQIESIPIPLPPLAEQQRIVDKLDVAYAQIETIASSMSATKENYSALKSAILAQELQPPQSEAA
jgi:type I restriction enzyme S subunit